MKLTRIVPAALLVFAAFAQLPMAADAKTKKAGRPRPNPPSAVVPKTSLEFWNSDAVQSGNNCYNYATNRRTDSFAQPGEASGQRYDNLTCDSVLKAAGKDLGLVRTRPFALGGSDRTLIALVVAPGSDFHWYRRDRSGQWSHKPGATAATVLDNSGSKITDPEKADRGSYTEFCGYFRVKNYAYRKDLQNGGYVRIGSMTKLPALPGRKQDLLLASAQKSEAEVMIYSGRRNPRVALRDLLADRQIGDALRAWSARQVGENTLGADRSGVPSRLGDNGIVIRDTEGLLLAKGSTAHLPSAETLRESPEQLGFVASDDQAVELSSAIRDFVLSRQ